MKQNIEENFMLEQLFFHKNVFFKRIQNAVLLYNVFEYKNRLKMHYAMGEILESINGVKTVSDIAKDYTRNYIMNRYGIKIDIKETLKYLIDNNFLTFNKRNGKIPELEQKMPAIDFVNLRITNRCNFNCIHCFPDSRVKNSDEYSYDDLVKIINDLAKYKVLHITFTGGEPFLNKNLIELVELSNSNGMIVSICTNASLINDEHMNRLSKCSIGALKISLDGASDQTHDAYRGKGRFDKLIPKIRKITDRGIPVCINSVISKLNFHEYKQIVNLAQDLKVTEFAFDIVRKIGRAVDNWNELSLSYEEKLECVSYYNSLHPKVGNIVMGSAIFSLLIKDILQPESYNKACGLCLSNILILGNGDVTPCWRLYDIGLIAGNLKQTNLDSIWSDSDLFNKVRGVELDSLKKCNRCEHNKFCDASCRGFAMQNHNDWYGEPDPERCQFHKDLINYKSKNYLKNGGINKMTDVLLIQPNVIDEKTNPGVPPLGLCYISASLKKNGINTKLLDLSINKLKKAEVLSFISRENPKVIGISLMISTYAHGMELCYNIRENFCDIPIVVGGPHATCIPGEILRSSVVDIVNLFEGEETFLEIVNYFTKKGSCKLSKIKGIAYVENGKIVKTPIRPFISDLDKIPFPDREILEISKYSKLGTITTGRGCIYSCKFCSSPYLCGNKYRLRSIDNVVEELHELHFKYNVKDFMIFDDAFLVNDDRIYEFCDKVKNMGITWSCYSRLSPDLPKKLLKKMKEAGLIRLSFGIESGNDEILKNMNKKYFTKDVEDLIKNVHEEEIPAICFFMVGFPEETHQTVRDTFRLAQKLRSIGTETSPVIAIVGALTPMPKSYIYEARKKLGIKILSDNWNDFNFFKSIIETKELSNKDLNQYLLF